METIGSLVDKLCTVDLKMWNNQEALYEIRRMSRDEFMYKYFSNEGMDLLWHTLKKACDLNVQRNNLIYELDQKIIETIKEVNNGRSEGYALNPHKTY